MALRPKQDPTGCILMWPLLSHGTYGFQVVLICFKLFQVILGLEKGIVTKNQVVSSCFELGRVGPRVVSSCLGSGRVGPSVVSSWFE